MEIEERQRVLTGPVPRERSGRRRSRAARRALICVAGGCAVFGGVMVLLPSGLRPPALPAPGPVAGAMTAVAAGVPVSLRDLTLLVADREAYLRTHPRDARSWAVLGTAYVEQGRRTATPGYFPKAERALRTSLATGPSGNLAALQGLAALANSRADFRKGREWGETARKLAPGQWTTYPLLIDSYRGLGDYKASRKALEKLQKLHSGPPVMARAAEVYWDRGWREDAVASLSDAATGARTPIERAAWLAEAGRLAWERGDREESLRSYEGALRLDRNEPAALAGRGRALAALGRVPEASRVYQAAFAGRPAPGYALELGELYQARGLGSAARAQYDLVRTRVRSETAGGVDDALVLGLFEADHGDAAEAVRRLRAEWKRQPGIGVADALGWALHRAGKNKEALKFAARATDKEHGGGVRSALYVYHRGQIERGLDLTGAARRHLAESLQINPYFSPLLAPLARRTLDTLGEPSTSLPSELEEEPTFPRPEAPEPARSAPAASAPSVATPSVPAPPGSRDEPAAAPTDPVSARSSAGPDTGGQ
ncbi:tetratricopeptide repeat protein [Streptomyces fagopyri]|uniref:Tetratricopeptide repeat protein n=1 Tax=Streptomyces fagopyri TaxID=2662397 RepID=A0A5Q0LGF3_9ACTN|nr:tetratricopeptide repeat protein [Streptomyces fagopyri]QFZ76088.1 tetratricopeptide repeat protein [Streptomyces fagopyri]